MPFNNKYNVGEFFWCMCNNKPTKFKIDSVEINIYMDAEQTTQHIKYLTSPDVGYFIEDEIKYFSKDELVNSLKQ